MNAIPTNASRILVVDDHETVRKGVCSILASRTDMEVCGEASNGQEAIAKVTELKPDLVIMDITMPVLGGFGAAKEIKKLSPNPSILFLSMHESRQLVEEAKLIGVQGFVAKDQAGKTLLDALDALLRGQTFFPA